VPLIYTHDKKLNKHECLPAKLSFGQLPFENKAVFKRTSKGVVQFGRNISELREYLVGILSLSGMLWPASTRVSIKDRFIKLGRSRKIIPFSELRVFNTIMVSGLEIDSVDYSPRLVYDLCEVTTKKHNLFLIYGDDDFAKEIYFNKHNKILVKSLIKEENLLEFEYGVVALRYLVADLIKRTNLPYFIRGLEVEHKQRTVFNQDKDICLETEGVIYDARDIEQFCKEESKYILDREADATKTPNMSQAAYHCHIHRTISDLIG